MKHPMKTHHYIDKWATSAALRAAAREQSRDGSFVARTLNIPLGTQEAIEGLCEAGWLMPAGQHRYRFTETGLRTIENLTGE